MSGEDTVTNAGSSEFVSFGSSDAKLGTLEKVERGIMMTFKKLDWGAHCSCKSHACNLHLFFIFFQF